MHLLLNPNWHLVQRRVPSSMGRKRARSEGGGTSVPGLVDVSGRIRTSAGEPSDTGSAKRTAGPSVKTNWKIEDEESREGVDGVVKKKKKKRSKIEHPGDELAASDEVKPTSNKVVAKTKRGHAAAGVSQAKCTAKAAEYWHHNKQNGSEEIEGGHDDEGDDITKEDGYKSDVLEDLEGVMHEGEMLLVDPKGRVFSSIRDKRGELVQVGYVDKKDGNRGLV
ncbi:unnamed protein product, partial [Discosporangium mesarthrocarpum]